ncbi:MAG: hypothetical protein IPP28_03130 [Xanthomonadales bacterium]|nr:hypothetical protein [Xanthomonadales bacterium]
MQERQHSPAWGSSYVPAIHATPKEAPSVSHASILHPAKLGGREMHLLSKPERNLALLALHCSSVWDIHEQRILAMDDSPHPLHGHAKAAGMHLDHLVGTITIADRIGSLSRHGKVKYLDDETEKWCWAAYPYVGDLLLFVDDAQGPFCLNWNVKDKANAFRKRLPRNGKPVGRQDEPQAIQRHELEAQHYQSGGIRTFQVAGEWLDFQVRCNLRELFLWHSRDAGVPRKVELAALAIYRDAIGGLQTTSALVSKVMQTQSVSREQAMILFKQGVWNRTIPWDLFTPLLMDQPLRAQTRDVFDVYGDWFRR